MKVLVLCTLFASALVPSGLVHADVVEDALRLVRQGRLPEARNELVSALDASPSPAIAFNLALVERELANLSAAVRLFDRLLASEFGALPTERRERVVDLRVEVIAEMPRLAVRWAGEGSVSLQVDGRSVGQVASGERLELPVDAGNHLVSAMNERVSIAREVTVPSGVFELVLEPPQPAPIGSPEITSPEIAPDFSSPSNRPHRSDTVAEHTSGRETTELQEAPLGEDDRRVRRRRILLSVLGVLVAGSVLTAVLVSQRVGDPPPQYVDIIEF